MWSSASSGASPASRKSGPGDRQDDAPRRGRKLEPLHPWQPSLPEAAQPAHHGVPVAADQMRLHSLPRDLGGEAGDHALDVTLAQGVHPIALDDLEVLLLLAHAGCGASRGFRGMAQAARAPRRRARPAPTVGGRTRPARPARAGRRASRRCVGCSSVSRARRSASPSLGVRRGSMPGPATPPDRTRTAAKAEAGRTADGCEPVAFGLKVRRAP